MASLAVAVVVAPKIQLRMIVDGQTVELTQAEIYIEVSYYNNFQLGKVNFFLL